MTLRSNGLQLLLLSLYFGCQVCGVSARTPLLPRNKYGRWTTSPSSRSCRAFVPRGGANVTDEATEKTVADNKDSSKANKAGDDQSTNNKQDSKQAATQTGDKYRFSLYQPGDGSEEDPDGLPRRFLQMQKGNREAAKAALEYSLKWREEEKVDTILQRPHPNFDICKAITPHAFLGRDKTGHIVFFQRPAVDSGEHLTLAHKNHMNNHDLVLHYVYVLEYCWNLLDPPTQTVGDNSHSANSDVNATADDADNSRTMTSIIDLTGLDFSILRHREMIGFVKQFVSMMSTHYPQRAHKTLLLNAPSWFGMLYKFISPMLRESSKAKVVILHHGKHQVEVLREILGDECLQYMPPELLETGRQKRHKHKSTEEQKAIPLSPMEQGLRDFCCAQLQEAGLEMNPLIK